jgi:hypothetical protein
MKEVMQNFKACILYSDSYINKNIELLQVASFLQMDRLKGYQEKSARDLFTA